MPTAGRGRAVFVQGSGSWSACKYTTSALVISCASRGWAGFGLGTVGKVWHVVSLMIMITDRMILLVQCWNTLLSAFELTCCARCHVCDCLLPINRRDVNGAVD